jgi:ribosomal protein S18 acetylase RimI-like enzyme
MRPRLVPSIRHATFEDAKLLADLGTRTFRDAFAADNTPEDLELYLRQAYGEEKQLAELRDPTATFLLAFDGPEPLAYLKLRNRSAPLCVIGPSPIEIERLYVDRPFWGRGVADALMERANELARQRGCRTIWLGVWEHNARAKAFYRRWGFRDVGSQLFILGTDPQTDRILVHQL